MVGPRASLLVALSCASAILCACSGGSSSGGPSPNASRTQSSPSPSFSPAATIAKCKADEAKLFAIYDEQTPLLDIHYKGLVTSQDYVALHHGMQGIIKELKAYSVDTHFDEVKARMLKGFSTMDGGFRKNETNSSESSINAADDQVQRGLNIAGDSLKSLVAGDAKAGCLADATTPPSS